MTEPQQPEHFPEAPAEATDGAIADVLAGLSRSIKAERQESDSYQAMAASDTVGQVVRRLNSVAQRGVLDAFDVLHEKFGMEKSHRLYSYLPQIPFRWALYEKAFGAETFVGSVDRTVQKLTAEINQIADATAEGSETAGFDMATYVDPRVSVAALAPLGGAARGEAGVIGFEAATNVLVLADQFDQSRRIQRMSCDVRKVTEQVLESFPDLDAEKVRGMVRLVLSTAVNIAREQDGLER